MGVGGVAPFPLFLDTVAAGSTQTQEVAMGAGTMQQWWIKEGHELCFELCRDFTLYMMENALCVLVNLNSEEDVL